MCIKINRKATFLSSTVGRKSQNIVVTHPSTPYFLSSFFKTFVTHPPKINELDSVVTPQNLERAPCGAIFSKILHLNSEIFLHFQ